MRLGLRYFCCGIEQLFSFDMVEMEVARLQLEAKRVGEVGWLDLLGRVASGTALTGSLLYAARDDGWR